MPILPPSAAKIPPLLCYTQVVPRHGILGYSRAAVKAIEYTEKYSMSNTYPYLVVLSGLFLLCGNGAVFASADINPTQTHEDGQEAEKTDLGKALELYCTAARQGFGPAQYEAGRIYASRPGRQEDESGGRRDIAAAMMWLDMAVINKVAAAKKLRRDLGILAKPEDFALYGNFSRMEAEAPCLWDEVYPPPEKRDGQE